MADGGQSGNVSQVLACWVATEVLNPQLTRDSGKGLSAEKQGQQRNEAATERDGPDNWQFPGDNDPTPWPIQLKPSESDQDNGVGGTPESEKPRPSHSVVRGALTAERAFERLDAAFADPADEDETNRRAQGRVIAATVVLDRFGTMVPDSSRQGWAGWDEHERGLQARFGSILRLRVRMAASALSP